MLKNRKVRILAHSISVLNSDWPHITLNAQSRFPFHIAQGKIKKHERLAYPFHDVDGHTSIRGQSVERFVSSVGSAAFCLRLDLGIDLEIRLLTQLDSIINGFLGRICLFFDKESD